MAEGPVERGRQEVETIRIITSLTAAQADAAPLLELMRQYWSIEMARCVTLERP